MICVPGIDKFLAKAQAAETSSIKALVYRCFENRDKTVEKLVSRYWPCKNKSVSLQSLNKQDPNQLLRMGWEILTTAGQAENSGLTRTERDTLCRGLVAVSLKVCLAREAGIAGKGFFLGVKHPCRGLGKMALKISQRHPFPHTLFTQRWKRPTTNPILPSAWHNFQNSKRQHPEEGVRQQGNLPCFKATAF